MLKGAVNDQGETREALRALVEEMRIIQRVAGQCSVEGPQDTKSAMAAAEAERAGRWADALDAVLSTAEGPSTESDAFREAAAIVESFRNRPTVPTLGAIVWELLTAADERDKVTGKRKAAPFADMPDSPKRDRMLMEWAKKP